MLEIAGNHSEENDRRKTNQDVRRPHANPGIEKSAVRQFLSLHKRNPVEHEYAEGQSRDHAEPAPADAQTQRNPNENEDEAGKSDRKLLVNLDSESVCSSARPNG